MKAFFVAIDRMLGRGRLAAEQRRLARRLAQRGIALCALKAPEDVRGLVVPLSAEASGAIVVAIDDQCPLPDKAPWLSEVTDEAAATLLGRDEKGLYRTMVRLGMGRRGKRETNR
jgi:hypothetical protein